MCVAVINSPNNAQAGPPPRPVCGCVSGGRDPDLISINCAGPAAVLEPHMFLLFCGVWGVLVSQWTWCMETARCTHSL